MQWMPNGLNPALDESLRSFLRLSYSILLVSKIFQLGTANKIAVPRSENHQTPTGSKTTQNTAKMVKFIYSKVENSHELV